MANSLKNIAWTRLGFESVLIVVSILFAFAIDRWWSDRQDSIEEQSLLRQLETEFEENVLKLAERRVGHEEARAAGLRLLSVMGPDAEIGDLGIENARDAFIDLLYRYTFDPGTGALSAIIHSGKLDLISSEELRTNLAAWPARYRDLSEDELWVIALSQDRLSPYYDEFATIRNFSPVLADIRPSAFPEDVETMLRDRKFENIRLAREYVAQFDYRPAKCEKTYRVVVLHKDLEVFRGQQKLFDKERCFFYITNIPKLSPAEVVQQANGRCNQENHIEQLKNGVPALTAPLDNLVSNGAYMVMAALAWSLKAWAALLLPEQGRWHEQHHHEKQTLLRMDFATFRNAILNIPAQIVRTGRKIIYRLLSWNRWQGVFFRLLDQLALPLRC